MNVNNGIDALSLRSQVSQTSKLSDMSIASLFDKKEELRRPSKILKIRRAQISGAINMTQSSQLAKEK